jgi:hypothetical protein
MNADSQKLVLSRETLRRLETEVEDRERRGGGTHPTTTVNTVHTGCC